MEEHWFDDGSQKQAYADHRPTEMFVRVDDDDTPDNQYRPSRFVLVQHIRRFEWVDLSHTSDSSPTHSFVRSFVRANIRTYTTALHASAFLSITAERK